MMSNGIESPGMPLTNTSPLLPYLSGMTPSVMALLVTFM